MLLRCGAGCRRHAVAMLLPSCAAYRFYFRFTSLLFSVALPLSPAFAACRCPCCYSRQPMPIDEAEIDTPPSPPYHAMLPHAFDVVARLCVMHAFSRLSLAAQEIRGKMRAALMR